MAGTPRAGRSGVEQLDAEQRGVRGPDVDAALYAPEPAALDAAIKLLDEPWGERGVDVSGRQI